MIPGPNPARRIGLTWSVGFLLIHLALPARTSSPASISRRTLNNGLSLVYEKDSSSPLTVLSLVIAGGQRDEPQGLAGLACLTTRLLLEIQDARSAQVLMQQSSSAGMAAQGDFCVITIEALSENFEETLHIMSGSLLDPLFSGLRLDNAKESMLHQRLLSEDDSVQLGHQAQLRAIFGDTGYGASAYGTEDSLKAIKGKHVAEYYRSHFRAGNIVLAVISDLSEEDVAGILQKNLGALPSGPAAPLLPLKPFPHKPEKTYLAKKTSQTLISYGFRLPELTARSFALASLTENVLGKGLGSRLWPLRQKEMLAYNVAADATLLRESGLLEVYLETDDAQKIPAASRLKQVLADLGDKGIDSEELEAAKTMTKANILRDNETKDRRCSNRAFGEVLGLGGDFLGRFPAEIDSISAEEFNAYLQAYLDMGEASLVIVGPNDEIDGSAPNREIN